MHRRHFVQSAFLLTLLRQAKASYASADGAADAALPAFTSIPTGTEDSLRVPPGYVAEVLYPWGSPTGMQSGMPEFRPDASNSAQEQALQAGMHHDGMHFFALPGTGGKPRGLLVMNHEYTDESLLHADGERPWTAEKSRKSLHAVGVSVIEVVREDAGWRQVLPSRFARRIHGRTPIGIAGPAAGHALLRTGADPGGRQVLGTLANCAMGVTPWGTYLSCEENFHAAFGASTEPAQATTPEWRRYGLSMRSTWSPHWRFDERFDLARQPNEANRFGWVVEIDPFDPASTPVKRTALGRKRQESATCVQTRDGRLAVYMGDDSPFEFIYKFVSHARVRPGQDAESRRANRHLLDDGVLHVARFDAQGRGRWLPLLHGHAGLDAVHGFADQAEVLIHARLAATQLGATPMDRPEWIAVDPHSREVYVALTGNPARGTPGRPAVDAANPRAANLYGGILRWREDDDDAAATGFSWNHFVLAGDPSQDGTTTRYPTPDADAFGAPDGLHFDAGGLLWIQTDLGRGLLGEPGARLGNNQLLCANPATGRIRRFLVGPPGCEITGCVLTPDRRTLFVNIQHPGELRPPDGPHGSCWPAEGAPGSARPRSATVAVHRPDGAIVGT